MKKWIGLIVIAGLTTGCSESGEEIGVGISSRLASPVEQAKEVSEKAQQTRDISFPQ